MTRTAKRPKKSFLPATGWAEFKAGDESGKKSGGSAVSSALEKRREHRRLRRAKKKQCFHCRKFGHSVADCPQASEQSVGMCFKCGSSEHTSKDCRAKAKPEEGDFPFAKCFICKETGHLSKQCPENPRGIYPMGGCCRLCGSVEHKRSDCPEHRGREPEEKTLTLREWRDHESADAVDEEQHGGAQAPVKKAKVKSKVVRF